MFDFKKSVVLVASFAAVLLAAPTAGAQTPDGESPAEESVCSDLVYRTPGLYGLCVAFCEAQDCEPDWTNVDDPFAECRPSSTAILEVYRRTMQPGDPDMPCLRTPCPCWSPWELENLRYPAPKDHVECAIRIPDGKNKELTFWSITLKAVSPVPPAPPVYSYFTRVKVWRHHFDARGPACFLFDMTTDPAIPEIERFFPITAEQFDVCEKQVHLSGHDRGIKCGW